MTNKIRVFAPATIANVGPGFDIFGLALNEPGDEVELLLREERGVIISEITGDNGLLPMAANKNTASVAVGAMLEDINADFGVTLKLHKKMPVGSGLGSSAASSVAGVFALNNILDEPLDNHDLLKYAVEGEKITSGGSVHLDNVAACLYGGFVLVREKNPPDIISINLPPDLICTVIHPRIEIKTSESRKMLKRETTLESAIIQWGNIAGMVTAFYKSDMELLSRSLKDVIAEPVRSILIPEFDYMRDTALQAGALGFSISGSGPSVFALSTSQSIAEKIAAELNNILKSQNIENDVYISPINDSGPRVL